MKKLNLHEITRACGALLLSVLLLLCSCSKDKEEIAQQLLGTVPSSAGVVAVVDCEQIIDKAGGAEAVVSAISGQTSDPSARKVLDAVGKSWDRTCAVIFSDGYYVYLTARLDDPGALKNALNADPQQKLAESDGVAANAKVAIAGDHVWVLLSKGNINALNIKGYADLGENRSFAKSEYAGRLVDTDKDVAFIGDMAALFSQNGGSFNDSAMTRMALSTLFKDAVYIAGSLNFEKGKQVAVIKVLDSKYRPAEYLLPTEKIDTSVIDGTATTAAAVVAVSAPRELIDKIKGIGASFGGTLPGEMLNMLNPIDGTMAVAVGEDGSAVKGVITVNESGAGALDATLYQMKFSTQREGNRLNFSKGGGVAGMLEVARVSPLFKGAIAGAVSSKFDGPGMDAQMFKQVSVMLYYEKKSIELKAVIETADENENVIKTIMRAVRK